MIIQGKMVYSSCMKLFSRWSTKHHNGGDSKGEWYSDSRVHTTPSLLDIDEQHYGDQQVTQHPAQKLLLAQGSCFLDRMHHPTMVMESMQDLTLSCLHSFYIKFPIFYCMTTCLGSGKGSRGSHTIQVANWNPRRTQIYWILLSATTCRYAIAST